MSSYTDSESSDYDVEFYIQPKRVRRTVNGDSADLLGNFDDVKRNEILEGTYKDPSDDNESDVEELKRSEEEGGGRTDTGEDDDDSDDAKETAEGDGETAELSKEQLASLLRGTSKSNRHVLYVTNLEYTTSQGDLEEFFGAVGEVKAVRVPRRRRGRFAFVEMADLYSYQQALKLHNRVLHGRTIRVQFSEAGKKKSANKKNIIRQKNRKLAEMRNEAKAFTKSGKFYDKTIKKEKAKEMLARKRWRKKPSGPPSNK